MDAKQKKLQGKKLNLQILCTIFQRRRIYLKDGSNSPAILGLGQTMQHKKVAILQSNYIPWKGYFDMIAAVDEFILYDDMQYTRRDWRNRNQIKAPEGLIWLTVPVQVKGKFLQKIRDTKIDGSVWAENHWRTLQHCYRRAAHFDEIFALLGPLFTGSDYDTISDLNFAFISTICGYLGIKTKISRSWDYALGDGKTERLLELCQQAGAKSYISGPAARSYIDEDLFVAAGIDLTYFDYAGYPEYPQLWGEFQHSVSIVDLLFNCGPKSAGFMKYVARHSVGEPKTHPSSSCLAMP